MPPDPTQPTGGGTGQPPTPLPPPTPQSAPQGQSLDPSVVALTKAIGMAETPKTYGTPAAYSNPSPDPGSPPSAYQFTPAFIDKWGPTVLGSQYQKGNYNLTPAQQDELAYGAVKTMGTTGDPGYEGLGKLTPQQIASAWNSGDPNAYLDENYQGTNKAGQSYNVPQYVSKVEANYNKLFPQNNQTASNPLVSSANAASGPISSSSSSGPSWSDILLGGGAAIAGWLGGLMKGGGSSLLTDVGAGIGEDVAGPVGAVAGGGAVNSLLGALGLNGTSSTGDAATGNVSPETPTGSGDISTEIAALEQSQPKTNKNIAQQYGATMSSLGSTIDGRKMTQDSNVQSGIQTASMMGLMNPQLENGSMNYQPNMDQAEKMIGDTYKLIQQAEQANGTVLPMQQVIEDAQKEVKSRISPTEYDSAGARLNNLGSAYLKEYGDGQGNISTGHALEAAVKEGRGKKYGLMETSSNKEVDKQFSLAMRRAIRKHTKNPELYNKATKFEQDLINAKRVMKKLNGKKAPLKSKGGLMRNLLHRAGSSLAIAIGDKIGGIPGAIIGSLVGDVITGKIDKKYSKTIFETPGMHRELKNLAKKSPTVYARLRMELKKQGVITPKVSTPVPSHKTKRSRSPQEKKPKESGPIATQKQ